MSVSDASETNSMLNIHYTESLLSQNEREELTIAALLSLSSDYGSEKRCRYKLCSNSASKRSPFCKEHIGSRSCGVINCKKYTQGGTQFCISHGGGHRCTFAGCKKGARGKMFCALHGGGKRCTALDCSKLAVGSSGRCAAHGGGKKCSHDGCTKAAQSPTCFCVRHGGGKKCQILDCMKVSRGRSGYCAGHGHMYCKEVSLKSIDSNSEEESVFYKESPLLRATPCVTPPLLCIQEFSAPRYNSLTVTDFCQDVWRHQTFNPQRSEGMIDVCANL